MTTREDLVTAFWGVVIRPFHLACYAKSLKGITTLFVRNRPLNGGAASAWALIWVVVAFIVFVVGVTQPYAPGGIPVTISFVEKVVISLFTPLLLLIPAIPRFYSWYRYESQLPD